ncbi:MAG: GAF domain-containing sensor histidine kinase, partial [Chitinophagaceae bacterium]
MTTAPLEPALQQDIARITRIPIIHSIMDVVAQTTGMGFVGVARVTDAAWIACAVRDRIGFGLRPGEELPLESTICNEIRQHRRPVVIDEVATDPAFCSHHTPLRYGFQSYISFPILRRDGSFFGTLCAIDPVPRHLTAPAITGMFTLFAELISFHLGALEDLEQSSRNLERTATELLAFTHLAAHDLMEPLRKIRFYTDRALQSEDETLSERGRTDLNRVATAAGGMQGLVRALNQYGGSAPEAPPIPV